MLSGRRFAFDVGKARIGVASSDFHAILASPLEHIKRTDDLNAVCTGAAELLKNNDAVCAYVGLPTNLKNLSTASTDDAVAFALALSQLATIPVHMIDERFSTTAAASSLRAAGHTAKNQKGIIDSAAAAVILEQALSIEKATGAIAGKSAEQVANEI